MIEEQPVRDSGGYAKPLEDRLKDRVLADVFPELASGFVSHIQHLAGRQHCLGQDRLDEVFRGTLTLLYRLLFLLYAEDRGLLPAREKMGHGEQSLSELAAEIAAAAGETEDEVYARLSRAFSSNPTETRLYDRLMTLCRIVALGDPARNLAPYNGMLFFDSAGEAGNWPEAETACFLGTHKVPDRQFALALHHLTRDCVPNSRQLVPIDYKSIGVRLLGSIYERLLQSRLSVVAQGEDMLPERAIVSEARKRQASVQTPPVCLVNAGPRRKASGSYYTPDYIVQHIVEHAVGPALSEHLERVRPTLERAQEEYEEAVRWRAVGEKRALQLAGDGPAAIANDGRWQSAVDELFNFRLLDPAMGSGHFLVEALDFIADRMLSFLSAFRWNPVQAQLRNTRKVILSEMEREGVAFDPAKLTDANLLKRQVLKTCIYGVDLDPTAVELAKVSLWLHCFDLGPPLCFLDHHLKCGDSLIGELAVGAAGGIEQPAGNTAEDATANGQFQDLATAIDSTRRVGEILDSTTEQVRRSRALYESANDSLASFRRAFDLSFGRWFANGPLPRFFHWGLEFPDVYHAEPDTVFEPGRDAGFQAVVGNPPWVSYSGRQAVQQSGGTIAYYTAKYQSARGWLSTQALFLERCASLVREGGRVGLALPAQISDLAGFKPVREYLAGLGEVTEPCAFHGEGAFEGVTEPAITVIFERGRPRVDQADRWHVAELQPGARRCMTHPAPDDPLEPLLRRLISSEAFGPEVFGDPGVHTGNSAAELLAETREVHCEPVREGRDITRFAVLQPRIYLRTDRAKTQGRYFRIGPLAQYVSSPILLRQTARGPIAAIHRNPTYFRNSVLACYGAHGISDAALAGLLNSKLFAWLYRRRNRDARQQSFPQVKVSHLACLPRPPLAQEHLLRIGVCSEQIERLSALVEAELDRISGLLVLLPGADCTVSRLFKGWPSLRKRIRNNLEATTPPFSLADGSGFAADRFVSRGVGDPGSFEVRTALEGHARQMEQLLLERTEAFDKLNDLVFRLYDVPEDEASGM